MCGCVCDRDGEHECAQPIKRKNEIGRGGKTLRVKAK